MRRRHLLALALVLLVAPLAFAGEEDETAAPPSPVGVWRLDREAAEIALGEDAPAWLAALLIPDLEIRIRPGGRFESLARRPGQEGEGTLSKGTWVQSEDVVSLAALRDDGLVGSIIGRLRDGRLYLSMGRIDLPLRRVEEEQAASDEPPPAETQADDEEPTIGIGPGPSIELPLVEEDDGAWPPLAITQGNRRRVAERLAGEVLTAVAAARHADVEEPWPGIAPSHVVHVRSGHDLIGAILEAWRLPHVDVTTLELLERGGNLLPKAKVVLVPCMETLPRALEAGLARSLRAFVEEGGYLATTDWSVRSVLAPAFPELVTVLDDQLLAEGMICPSWVPPMARREPGITEGIPVSEGIDLWCEPSSCPFELPDVGSTVPLVATNRLHLELELPNARALVFAAKRNEGKLLHAMAQLYQERGSVGGARALQRLFLNFIAEGLDGGA